MDSLALNGVHHELMAWNLMTSKELNNYRCSITGQFRLQMVSTTIKLHAIVDEVDNSKSVIPNLLFAIKNLLGRALKLHA